jgi:hypothetical protein
LTGGFLLGWLTYATAYLVIGLVLYPNDHLSLPAVGQALVWGLIMQALLTRQRALKTLGREPYPPALYIGIGVAGVVLWGWRWSSMPQFPTGVDLFVMLGGVALWLWILVYGLIVARHRRHLDSPVGGS